MKRPWAIPLVPLYAAAQATHGLAYRLRLARATALNAPVISVGSLSAGGAGKTPVVLMLARLLKEQGFAVDVLSRGYKRAGREPEQVVLSADHAALRFGDEPVELAQAGLRVFVGRERRAAGQLAETRDVGSERLVHLLDDGFQHRRMARQLDVVLLTQADMEDSLLPAGDLREPLRALTRANVVILRDDEADTLTTLVRALTEAEIWRIHRQLVLPPDLTAPLLFSGIARPATLRSMLKQAGVAIAGHVDFPDHHAYTSGDLDAIDRKAKQTDAQCFLTTAKDAVKLTPTLRRRLESIGPVHVARLEASLDEPSLRRLPHVLATLLKPQEAAGT